MKKVLERLGAIEANQKEILTLLRGKESRAAYNKRYYAEKKRVAEIHLREGRIRNPDRNNLDLPFGKDRRLVPKFGEWAKVGFKFAAENRPFQFLEWLCYQWQDVYTYRPITRSGGYNQLFIGWSNKRALRVKVTDCDMFANVKRLKFNKVQRDQFREAMWWKWSYGVLCQVLRAMEDDSVEEYTTLPKSFTKPLRLMCGGYGEVEVKQGLFFDQNLDLHKLSEAYRWAKPDLDRGWTACIKGLQARQEPFAEFVNGPTVSPSQSP